MTPDDASKTVERQTAESVDTLAITPAGSLDGITVYWHNYEPGRGMVTVVCWGSAWNCFFGAMSGDTIQNFFRDAPTDYLVGKLMSTQWQAHTKRHEAYLCRVVTAIKNVLR